MRIVKIGALLALGGLFVLFTISASKTCNNEKCGQLSTVKAIRVVQPIRIADPIRVIEQIKIVEPAGNEDSVKPIESAFAFNPSF